MITNLQTMDTQASELLRKHPYFAYAALKALVATDSPEERTRLKGILSANIGSDSDLREILGLNSGPLADFYSDSAPHTLSTEATIDTFLSQFGGDRAAPVASPATDYASTLLTGDENDPLPDLGLPADSPFLAAPAKADRASVRPPETLYDTAADSARTSDLQAHANDTPAEGLTESFARILIKNRNYSKALEIIEDLNLKNPEKSIYFADQIRFLKKLIITQSKSSGAS